ncbi:aminopeptidase N-like [Cheilinus undulatus]|uniref:aminopeptidase N-like n=1 Tax=Cheilinus undulatus TaxID=241271 RepID=UPI001BD35F7F|nr:aminopeptidase N-like [Cheilinus undulatus]XP_041649444.1 aminopeptidase N-like [Cheilinus undulatus]
MVYYITKTVGLGLVLLASIAVVTTIPPSRNQGATGDEAAGIILPFPTVPAKKEAWDQYRLPDSLSPVSYDVTLWPRLMPDDNSMYIFTGHSTVHFNCVKETNLIIIHSNKLNLTSFDGNLAKLTSLTENSAPAILKSWLVVETEFLVLQLQQALTVGATYSLYTEFVGELADDLHGLYRSKYVEDGVEKVAATSHMQATYARKAFPCFDEPAMKAVFNVSIIHDPNTVALSNGREIATEDSIIDGVLVRKTTFEPTRRMSSYLLALIVCDFTSIQSTQSEDVLVRIWARKKAIDDGQGEYALKVTGPILQFYEQYYNVPYPLSKSDQIALPDFSAGAMENWGLITYRETALLYDPFMSSNGNKERVTTVVAHELAHQWFGNLVTVRWWNDLWLNEGFASYVEYLGADHAEPTFNIKDMIILDEVHKVFAVDALASSHPLTCREDEVKTPAQISEMFGTISYSKGASVIRMLSEFLSEPVFARGLSSYLNTFAFSNTVYKDLWDHLQQAVDNTPNMQIPCTIHDIMNRWTLQMGFPVVTVDTQTGSIAQEHFLLDPDSVVERPSEFNYTWIVPIKWMKTGVEQQQYWLLDKTDANDEMRVSGEDWILLNTNASGYFRVNYDLHNWDRLLALLNTNHEAVSVINRAQIIDDAFNLARAKIITTTLALRTTKYLSMERDYIPWQSALENLKYYILMFDRTEVYGALQAYLKKQIQPLFEHYKKITDNWTKVPAGHTDQYNQINAISYACKTNVEGCRDLVKGWFRQWMENPQNNPIHPNLKSVVYCNAIAYGGVEEWEFAWKMFKETSLATESTKLRSALACSREPWLLNRYLDYSLDPNKIRKQDATSTISSIAGNVVGMPLAWNFVRARWSDIFEQYGQGQFTLSRLVEGFTPRFSTEFELQELKKFKEDNSGVGFGSATLAMEQAIEKTTANIKWVTENKADVLKWFTEESI